MDSQRDSLNFPENSVNEMPDCSQSASDCSHEISDSQRGVDLQLLGKQEHGITTLSIEVASSERLTLQKGVQYCSAQSSCDHRHELGTFVEAKS